MRTKKPKKKLKKYRALRRLRWGHVFDQPKGWEFTEADLLPGMKAALRKWLRVGAAVEIEIVEPKKPNLVAHTQNSSSDDSEAKEHIPDKS